MTATWLSKMELATYLGITTRTVDRWRKDADFYKFRPAILQGVHGGTLKR